MRLWYGYPTTPNCLQKRVSKNLKRYAKASKIARIDSRIKQQFKCGFRHHEVVDVPLIVVLAHTQYIRRRIDV